MLLWPLADARAGQWSFDDLPVPAIQGAFDAWALAAPCSRVGGVVTDGCPSGPT